MSKLLPGDDFASFLPMVERGPDAVWQAMQDEGVAGPAAIRGLRHLFNLSLPEAQMVMAGGKASFDESQEAMAQALLTLDAAD